MDSTTYWDWRPKGNCASLKPAQTDKLFFPESGRSINKAKAFCKNCPVVTLCLEYALDNELSGIWAGTSGEERRQMLRFKRQLEGVVTVRKIVARRNISFS